jgi:DNA-binding IclR family transcriptional regulator
MGTVRKALGLLDILAHPESRYGLTEMARLSGFDKATTRRLLLELKADGFVEQNEETRAYLLGPALLMLGRAREERFPFFKIAQPTVRLLSETSGETAHVSEYVSGAMASICAQETDKSNRVIVLVGERLPLHATASGLAYLAASMDAFVDAALRKPLPRFSANTITDPEALWAILRDARSRGYVECNQLRSEGVFSVGAAIVSPKGAPIGAIAVAMPSMRAEPEKIADIGAMTAAAATEISTRLFGKTGGTQRIRKL